MGEPVNPLVREVLRGLPVDTEIDLRDEMLLHTLEEHDWDFALTSYFQRGREAAALHAQFLDAFFGGRRDIDLLDFAAGFGRVTRFFIAMHGSEHVWASDIQEDAVAFQRAQFGVGAFLSSIDPAEFRAPRRFDLIVAVSFFSHVPPARFDQWLSVLDALLEANGILVFSVHGKAGGITFEEKSETDRLDPSEYGTTWVSESYVREAVARSCPGKHVVYIPRSLGSFQDVYVVYRDEPKTLEFDQGPFGYASIARLFDDEFHLVGWAAHWSMSRRVETVAVALNGEVVAETTSFFERPDVVEHLGEDRHLRSGWHLQFLIPENTSRMTDVLSIKAVSDGGVDTFLYVGTIAGLLLESYRADAVHDREEFLGKLAILTGVQPSRNHQGD